uniref:Pentraxin fusion protein-like n=1 Tax=Saccoglossus kowalevskii TaxID=10224 RepID=A0ABM0LWV2_SACKO|nr:PREDICTED: pentraxin fusion protein-like [Saccoglossus kowalevskii]
MQTSNYVNASASNKARDGDIHTCAKTQYISEPFWTIWFGSTFRVYEVTIKHNGDPGSSLTDAEIRVGANPSIIQNELCANRLKASQTASLSFTIVCTTPLYGMFLSIQIRGKRQTLTLCEVEIYGSKALSNVALDKHAEQSSQYRDGSAIKAVDGDTSSDYSHHSCMHTQLEYEPWWRVDIGYICDIFQIVITNRQDCCSDNLIGAEVRVGNSESLNENDTLCGRVTRDEIHEVDIQLSCEVKTVGRYVSVRIMGRKDHLHICEVKIFGKGIDFL